MSDHLNPFNPGSGLNPPYLAGRENEEKKFIDMLQRLRPGVVENMVMYGLRGVGKTVLLDRFADICTNCGFLPVTQFQYGNQHSRSEVFFQTFRHDFEDAVKDNLTAMEKAKKTIRSATDYLKPAKISILDGISYEPSYKSGTPLPLMHRLIEYMEKKWRVVKNGGYTGVVFLLDEFHSINGKNNQDTLENFIGAINELQRRGYGYWFVLCGLPMLKNNIKAVRSYSERMFKSTEIVNLDYTSATEAITKPLEKTPWRFSDELVAAIVQDTGQYPYFIQFYAKEIIERTDTKDIKLEDYVLIRDLIVKDLERDFFDQRTESISGIQKEILYAIARLSNSDMEFGTLIKATGKKKGALSKHLHRLEEKGIIYKYERGIYRFALPMFKTYLQRRNQSQNQTADPSVDNLRHAGGAQTNKKIT